MIQVIFSRNNSAFSYGIRTFTGFSPYSHCGLILPDNRIIESTFKRGVHFSSRFEFNTRASVIQVCNYSVPDEQAIYRAAISQIGKPYDKWAILGFPVRRNWQQESDWFCSELVGWSIMQGGRQLVKDVHRLMPDTLFQLRD